MRAGAQTRTKSLQEPLPGHGDAGSKAVFQNCRMSGGGPPPALAAALAWETPPAPALQGRAGHVLPGERDPELAWASLHTLWIFGVGLL